MEAFDYGLIVVILLLLSAIAADKSLGKHLDFLDHLSLLETLQIFVVLAQVWLVLRRNLSE